MKIGYSVVGYSVMMLLALSLATQRLAAQQPQQSAPVDSARRGMMRSEMQAHVRTMDSTTTVLDSLVGRMNRATGNAKVTAMAQVINTLVAERKAMRSSMHRMMEAHGERMRGDHRMKPMSPDSAHGHSE